MRLLYVLPAEGFGGAERQALQHIKLLPRFGIDVLPVVGPGKTITRELDRAGIEDYVFTPGMLFEYTQVYSRGAYARYVTRAVAAWLRGQGVLLQLLTRRNIDAVFAARTMGWMMTGLLAHYLGVPQIWRGGGRAQSPRQQRVLRRYSRICKPELFICNSRAVARSLEPLVRGPTRVVYNGVDLERFDPDAVARSEELPDALPNTSAVVGMVARPAPGKGLETLAEAMQMLQADGRAVHYLIAGESGWRRYYESLFQRRGLGDLVSFMGHVHRVERLLLACDVIVLPSSENSIEGFPNAILEAMAMRRAVVASSVGGIPEMIEHGESGFLIPPEAPQHLAAHIARLLDNPLLRMRMGQRARRRVEEHFSLHSAVAEHASLIAKVVRRQAIEEASARPIRDLRSERLPLEESRTLPDSASLRASGPASPRSLDAEHQPNGLPQ